VSQDVDQERRADLGHGFGRLKAASQIIVLSFRVGLQSPVGGAPDNPAAHSPLQHLPYIVSLPLADGEFLAVAQREHPPLLLSGAIFLT